MIHHLGMHQSVGPDGIHTRVLTKLAEVITKSLSIIYQKSWLTRELPVDWRLANMIPVSKEGPEGGSEYPQTFQSDLDAREGYGVAHLECRHAAHKRPPSNQAQSAWVSERHVLLD